MPARTGAETTGAEMTILDEALRLHAAGFWVVPQAGKVAVALQWNERRLSEDDLRGYLADGGLNIAIALHRTGWIDAECDSGDAERFVQASTAPEERATPTWRSQRGLHRLYLRPSGLPARAKVDARSGVEYRIGNERAALSTMPPSINDDGTPRAWLPGLSIWDRAPLPLPAALEADLRAGAKAGRKRTAAEADGSMIIPQGRRDDELFRHGCRLLRLGEQPGTIRDVLASCNARQCAPPLTDAELDRVLASVERYRDKPAGAIRLSARECVTWERVLDAWGQALHMRGDLADALAAMLATAASTMRAGDQQVFLQVIGAPGSAKTRICDAMLTSEHCYLLDRLTGFFSGMRGPNGEDLSPIADMSGKTLITPEADMLMSSAAFGDLMGQTRRIFDGTASVRYRNQAQATLHTGLRTPWIMAGTPETMLKTDQSRVGDRFIRTYIREPSDEERRRILGRACMTEFDTVLHEANCRPDSLLDEKLRTAYELTGGYVDWLRANVNAQIADLRFDRAEAALRIEECAEFAAALRARPDPDVRKDAVDTKELPARLCKQFVRIGVCLAVALNRPGIDAEVLRIIRKLALDTARGKTLDMVRSLHQSNPHLGGGAATADSVAVWTGQTIDRTRALLNFMSRIGVVSSARDKGTSRMVYRVTPKMIGYYEAVVLAKE